MSRYTDSQSADFTFIGRAESNDATDLLEKIEDCLIGLNLEPANGWAWVAEGAAVAGNLADALTTRVAEVLRRSTVLNDEVRGVLASDLADAFSAATTNFDRDHFIEVATRADTG